MEQHLLQRSTYIYKWRGQNVHQKRQDLFSQRKFKIKGSINLIFQFIIGILFFVSSNIPLFSELTINWIRRYRRIYRKHGQKLAHKRTHTQKETNKLKINGLIGLDTVCYCVICRHVSSQGESSIPFS